MYAILPPILAEELFDEEDLSPKNILLKFIKRINSIGSNPTEEQAPDVDAPAEDEIPPDEDEESVIQVDSETEEHNQNSNEDDDDGTSEDNTSPHPQEAEFSKILRFLFNCITDSTMGGVGLKICNKPSTQTWSDK